MSHRLPGFVLLLTFLVAACGNPPVKEEVLDHEAGVTRVDGHIVNIVEVQADASMGEEFGGALVGAAAGSLIGSGSGQAIAIGVGSVVGAKATDKIAGDMVHRLTLREDKTGLEFDCIVHNMGFQMNDPVVFTVRDGRVTSIIHKALLDAHEKSEAAAAGH